MKSQNPFDIGSVPSPYLPTGGAKAAQPGQAMAPMQPATGRTQPNGAGLVPPPQLQAGAQRGAQYGAPPLSAQAVQPPGPALPAAQVQATSMGQQLAPAPTPGLISGAMPR